ncbi:hypothetical protein M3Y97_00784200 [Aphelenchoides bicaudatus]|nr:hypothetical protein M3Y97_00784200 [Aphelenchoides bicaudatus]
MDWNSSTTLLNDKNLAIIIVTFEVFLNALRILSALATIYFLYRFNSVTVVHGNLKILVLFLPIAFTLASASQIIDQLLILFGGSQSHGIWLIMQLTGAFYGWAFLCCAFLPIFIFVERVIATLNKRTYEDFTRTIGICFVAANTMLSLLCVLIAVFGNCFLDNPHSLLHTPCWNLIFWTTFTLSSALCLMLNRYIACRNLRFESNEQSLAERFSKSRKQKLYKRFTPDDSLFLGLQFCIGCYYCNFNEIHCLSTTDSSYFWNNLDHNALVCNFLCAL